MSRNYLSAQERRGMIVLATIFILIIGVAVLSDMDFTDAQETSATIESVSDLNKQTERQITVGDSITADYKATKKKNRKKRSKSNKINKESVVRHPLDDEITTNH